MNETTAKLINEVRVKELLDCYGAESANWPKEEQAAAVALIKHSVELQQYQQESRRLDAAMQIHNARQELRSRPNSELVANIINALPEQPRHNTVQLSGYSVKNSPPRVLPWWKYGTWAAAAVIVLALTIIIQQPSQLQQPTQSLVVADVSQDDLNQWMWEEAIGISAEPSEDLTQDDNGDPTTFMAMVELESLTNHN